MKRVMKKAFSWGLVLGILLSLMTAGLLAVEVGDDAPDFHALDAYGMKRTLAQYKGKIVILEWNNPDCIYVKKIYKKGFYQDMQKLFTQGGVVWILINSTGRGSEGYLRPKDALIYMNENFIKATTYISDDSGAIGKLYGAEVTPEIFIINEEGKVVYKGAVDSIGTTDPLDAVKAQNYVSLTVKRMRRNMPITVSETVPYGCNIHYKDDSTEGEKAPVKRIGGRY